MQELTAEQRERMLRNRLLAEEKRLAKMKSAHGVQKVAEAGLSTVEGLTVQPSAQDITTSVLNMDTTDSAELPLPEINSSFIEAIHAHEVNSSFTGKANEKRKTIHFSRLVEAEDTNINSVAVNIEEANTTIIPIAPKELNINSELDDRRETNDVASMLDDSEQTHETFMPVDAEETGTVLISVNDTMTDATSPPIEVKEPDATSAAVEAKETDATCTPVEAKETGTTSLLLDAEETLSVDIEENI